MSSIRQQKVAQQVQEALGAIFQKHGRDYYGNTFVTITHVNLTADLLIARVYLSVMESGKRDETIERVRTQSGDIRYKLGKRLKSMRRIPELEFYPDELMEQQYRVNDILKDL